jgi:hypothetical protein
MKVRTEPATRDERDRATLALLGDIEAQAASAHAWLLSAVHYDEGDRILVNADCRPEAERRIAELRHLAAKLAATYGPDPVRVVPAEAVVDTGEHEPEDDGGPTNEEIDEAAKYAALVDFSHMTRAFRRVKGGAA